MILGDHIIEGRPYMASALLRRVLNTEDFIFDFLKICGDVRATVYSRYDNGVPYSACTHFYNRKLEK